MIQEKIRDRINDLGLTVTDVSTAIGEHTQNLCAFLNGRRALSIAKLKPLMTALGLTIGREDEEIGRHPLEDIHLLVKERLAELGINQSNLAKRCGTDPTTMSLFLNDKVSVSLGVLERIMEELKLGVVCYGRPTIS